MKHADHSRRVPSQPSKSLASHALAGLLGIAVSAGCGSDHSSKVADSQGSGAPASTGETKPPPTDADKHSVNDAGASSSASDAGTYNDLVSMDPITFSEFSDLCGARGGFVTTNANCAGSNLCKGLSYANDGTVLTEHSCVGLNSCEGLSCVDLPKSSGLTAQDIYDNGPCGGCHNTAIEGPANYVVFVHPGIAPADALATFQNSSDLRLESIVAFGTQGVNDDGVEFTNMPSFRTKYSRAEIEAVVAYVRGLKPVTKLYALPGQDAGLQK